MTNNHQSEFEKAAAEGKGSHLLGEFWAFLRENKKWWLLPIIAVLVALGGLLAVAGGSALAPFIYTIF